MPCYRCGRVQQDPKKGPSPWARAVVGAEQVLVCPECQQEHPDWTSDAVPCRTCGSNKLQIQLGLIVCRKCGDMWEVHPRETSF